MKTSFFILLFLPISYFAYSQGVGIGTPPNASAMLDISSTNRGLLVPRVALTNTLDATTITNGNVTSLIVYNTATIADVVPGYYYWDGLIWQSLNNTDRQDLSYDASTNMLSLTNDATPVNLSTLKDHDWYEVWGTNTADAINDAIFTQGNVGIENTNPSTKLQIGSTAGYYRTWMDYGVLIGHGTDGLYLGMKNEGADREDAIIAWGDNPTDNLQFIYNETGFTTYQEHLRIQGGTGNVGIGTTLPAAKLEVNGQVLQGPNTTWNEKTRIGINAPLTTVVEATVGSTNGNLHLEPKTNFHTYINHYSAGGNILMNTGNNTGNVGIGTANPTSKLTVNGVLEINKINDVSTIYFTNSASEPGYIRHSGNANAAEMRFVASDDFDAGSAQDKFTFGGETGSVFTEVMRIQGNGRVGIGTTAPSQLLHVVGNILASGTITSSDKRYKTGINSLKNSTALLGAINPVSYHFNTAKFPKEQFDEKLHFGLIAQELEEVLPNLVYTDEEGYKAVNYTDLIPLLIQSNQEQQAQIKQQQAQLDKQQTQIQTLISTLEAVQK